MQLYSQYYPGENPPIIIVHGLFGSSTNWRSIVPLLRGRAAIWLIDLRNHGKSPNAGTHSYFDMQQDLLEFLDREQVQKCILIGHSMGGKVAMLFSLLHPHRVAHLMVLDIAPCTYRHSFESLIDTLLALDLTRLKSRTEADVQLSASIADRQKRQFLLQSLVGTPGNYRWCINLPVLRRSMPEIGGFPHHLVANRKFHPLATFLHGTLSDYITEEHNQTIARLFPNCAIQGIQNAGHWLHIDQPQTVCDVILKRISGY